MNNYTLTLNTTPDNGLSLKVDLLNVKKASLILRAINHKLRQQILKLIDEQGKVLGQTAAQAQGNWMTEDYVGFMASLSYSTPATATASAAAGTAVGG